MSILLSRLLLIWAPSPTVTLYTLSMQSLCVNRLLSVAERCHFVVLFRIQSSYSALQRINQDLEEKIHRNVSVSALTVSLCVSVYVCVHGTSIHPTSCQSTSFQSTKTASSVFGQFGVVSVSVCWS